MLLADETERDDDDDDDDDEQRVSPLLPSS